MAANELYEIMKSFNDREILRDELAAASSRFYGSIYEKYLKKLNGAIDKYKSEALKNPNNKIRLMAALKPYFDENGNRRLDALIEAARKAELVKNLMGEIKPASAGYLAQSVPEESSVHKDGVYDVDTECVKKRKKEKSGPEYFQALLMVMAARRSFN